MNEPTQAQEVIIEQLAGRYPVVVVEDSDHCPGALRLQGAKFCATCGGDGFTLEDEQIEDCSPCNGTGGEPVLGTSLIVLPSGIEVIRAGSR